MKFGLTHFTANCICCDATVTYCHSAEGAAEAWNRRAKPTEASRLMKSVQAGFRCRPKGSSGAWSYCDHRAPDSFELRECDIETVFVSHTAAKATQGGAA